MQIVAITILALAFAGCSSAPRSGIDHAGEEKVLSRIDDLGSRPGWVTESTPFKIEDHRVMSLGMTVVPVDNTNMGAVYRIAENNGKAAVSHAIEQRLDYVFQNAEEGIELGASQAKFIGAEASKLTTSSMRLSKRYWEKVAITETNGQISLRYRVFSLVEMPEQEFKSAIVDAAKRAQGKQGISDSFAKQVDQHWNSFVNDGGSARLPAAKQDEKVGSN